jgi:hypothetical protein
MGPEKLTTCLIELRAGVGDAVEESRRLGGDPRADLILVEEIASERGITA